MAEHQRVQRVHDLLRQLHRERGTEPLKKLICSELNYDFVNKPLLRRDWSEDAAKALAADPVLLANAGEQFGVIHARLKSDKLLIADERPVVLRLLRDHPYAMFVFSNSTQDRWHFLNVKYDDDVQRRRLFRRITVGPEERLRTASERLDKINLADLSDTSPVVIQKLHDDAFDVEPVTKEFFREYGRIFDEVEGAIRGIRGPERKRLFTQRLFNRIMFIAFIQKKGWLKFGGDTDYLSALWKAHKNDKGVADKNFYRDRMKPLFFFGLNGGAQEADVANINRGGFLKLLIGEVPYLNGGLFEEDEDDREGGIVVPDKAIDAVLNELFARFNFTVTESTPLDVEVAVDPEMLGKIFEELVTGRHETGSYYTPKPIVSFMCREALKGYLEAQLRNEAKDAIASFVDRHDPSALRDAEDVLEALRRIKVCDPACGSGAYLVGMLHELLDLRTNLFATRKLDTRSAYDRKLEIIQSNVYGVDLDQFAVNIARLRLWLSLSVEYDGPTPPPLPNLDYKVEVGDTICSPNPAGFQIGLRQSLVDDFLKAKAEYMTAHYGHKADVRRKAASLRADVAGWAHRAGNEFDWPIDFAEVFSNGGFDVVLANPPYVRMELFKDIKPTLRTNFPSVHSERSDLYCYFYARGFEILREGGMFVFISSNKWLRAGYGANLRKFIAERSHVRSITDFGELPVFESAATFPMIFVARKAREDAPVLFTQVKSLDSPYPDVLSLIRANGQELATDALSGSDWRLATNESARLIRALETGTIPLIEWAGGRVFMGIKTGLNEAFVIDGATKRRILDDCPQASNVIKPFVRGDDIRKWRIDEHDSWLLYMSHGADVRKLNAVLSHLRPFKPALEERATKQAWYELQQPQEQFAAQFNAPKIVFPDIAKDSRFTLDDRGSYVGNTVYIIGMDDLYLLAVLNSSLVWEYVKATFTCIGDPQHRGRFRFFTQFVSKIPVPRADAANKKRIAALAAECLDAKGNCDTQENEIDERVARLYGIQAPQVYRAAEQKAERAANSKQ